MAKLKIEQPGVPGYSVSLARKTVRLGRAEDNDVVLVADEVSRHHAQIAWRDGAVVLQDLNSLNGTYVNRQRVVERILSNNDEVWFGSKCRLIFEEDANPAPAPVSATDSTFIQQLGSIRRELDKVESHITMLAGKKDASETSAAPSAAPDVRTLERVYRRLEALYEASKLLASDFDLPRRLGAVLDTAMAVMGAERGFVLLRDEETGELQISVARRMGQDLGESSPSMGIAGKAATTGEPVLMENREQDSQFGGRESVIVQKIASAMSVPLKLDQRVLGAIYVDTRQSKHAFSQDDLDLFASLASPSAMAIENARLYERMLAAERRRANLQRFLSPAIVDQIMNEDTALELGGRKRLVTTMFCDIRGFTPIAERLAPSELVALLNEHFTAMTAIIFAFQGTLDKYIGDEIMAVWGAPLSAPDDPARAVRAALMIQRRNAELNEQRRDRGWPEFSIGVGIATGEVIAGYVGSPDRMEFTVVGDRVNTARRLCSVAEAGTIVVGEDTYAGVADFVDAQPIGSVKLKGKEEMVDAYLIVKERGD